MNDGTFVHDFDPPHARMVHVVNAPPRRDLGAPIGRLIACRATGEPADGPWPTTAGSATRIFP